MEYTVAQIARMSGVSKRTLRYYDQIGLLKPARIKDNGYRIYSDEQIDLLQQILFYRELGVGLEQIQVLITAPGYDKAGALENHLAALLQKKQQIEQLILTVQRTLKAEKGECSMSAQEKFEGFTQKLIEDNERQYGPEIRAKYGDEAVDAANTNLKGADTESYQKNEALRQELESLLAQAVASGDPAGEQAQACCRMHKEWLSFFNPHYSKEYHKGLADLYVSDQRFQSYYDDIVPGGAAFLRNAIYIFANN